MQTDLSLLSLGWPSPCLFSSIIALEDRRVSAEDLKLAVKLAIAPRGIFMNTPQDEDEEMVR